MGRPLKIQKLSPGSGIITSIVANPVPVDQGFPQFQNLDPSTQVIPSGMTGAEYLGVTGGGYDGGVATATFPVVAVNAYFPIAAAGEAAYIITQKGQYKYLVAAQATVAVTAIISGNSYIINTLGTTNWTAIGAGPTPAVGDVFTATKVGTGTGLASEVVPAYLSNVATGSLVAGQMNMSFTPDGGTTTILASRLTNKYIWDDATPPNRYAVNFFTSNVTTAKSGADPVTWTNGTGLLDLAEVSNYTS